MYNRCYFALYKLPAKFRLKLPNGNGDLAANNHANCDTKAV